MYQMMIMVHTMERWLIDSQGVIMDIDNRIYRSEHNEIKYSHQDMPTHKKKEPDRLRQTLTHEDQPPLTCE